MKLNPFVPGLARHEWLKPTALGNRRGSQGDKLPRKKLPEKRLAIHNGGQGAHVPSKLRANVACAAVCGYWLLFGIPFPWDVSLVILAGICGFCAIQPGHRRSADRFLQLIALFVASVALSLLATPDLMRSMQFCLVLLPSLMVFYLLSEVIDLEQIDWLSNCLGSIGLLLGGWLLLVASAAIARSPTKWIKATEITFLQVPNDVVLLMILAPFSLVLFLRNPVSIMGVTGLIGMAVDIAVAVIYRSRLSVIILAVALGLTLAPLVGRKKLLVGGLFFITMLVFVDILGGGNLFKKFASAWGSRLPLWMASWCMFLKAPIFGNGPGSYLLGHRECLAGVVESDWLFLEKTRVSPWAHNLYLESLAEHGLAGFISLVIMLSYAIVLSCRLSSKLEGEIRQLNLAITVSLIAFCLAAIFELSLWRQWVTVLLFTLMGLTARIHTFVTMKGD